MATLTIRNVDPELREALRVRAARHGRSMEAELREIVKVALGAEKTHPELNLAEAICRRFAPLAVSILSCRRMSLSAHRPRSIRDCRRPMSSRS